MAHTHNIYDTDRRFSIDPITRAIKNEFSTKTTVIQNDHNSERFTFELPRYIEGHDMSICNRVEVHFININSANGTESRGVYEVDDLQIGPDDKEKVICSWLLSRAVTQYDGVMSFLVRFACVKDDVVEYAWNTAIHSNITVAKGIYNSETYLDDYVDVLERWKEQLFSINNDGVKNVTEAQSEAVSAIETAATAKQQEVLNSIPDDYHTLDANVTEYKAKVDSLANAIKGKASGAVVLVDDVSPVEHIMGVKVRSKNLLPLGTITLTKNKNIQLDTPIPVGTYTISAHITSSDTDSELSAVSINSGSEVVKYITFRRDTRVSATFVATKPITNIDFCAGYNYSQGADDTATWTDVQLEEGSTPTEYTPYVDPASVTVTKCGKNLISPPYAHSSGYASNGVTFTVEDDGSVIINGTPTATTEFLFERALKLPVGTYSFRLFGVEKSPGMCSGVVNQYNGEVWLKSLGSDRGNGVTFEVTEPDKEYVIRTNVYILLSEKTFTNFRVLPILCVGSVADNYEPYNGTVYTPTTDGTIHDMKSLAPTMTLFTDTPGTLVECEYNRDTNAVIADLYNKIAALSGE